MDFLKELEKFLVKMADVNHDGFIDEKDLISAIRQCRTPDGNVNIIGVIGIIAEGIVGENK